MRSTWPSVYTAQRTHHLVRGAVDRLWGFAETLVIAGVGIKLYFLGKVGPPLILDDLQHALKEAACGMKGSFLHGVG